MERVYAQGLNFNLQQLQANTGCQPALSPVLLVGVPWEGLILYQCTMRSGLCTGVMYTVLLCRDSRSFIAWRGLLESTWAQYSVP